MLRERKKIASLKVNIKALIIRPFAITVRILQYSKTPPSANEEEKSITGW